MEVVASLSQGRTAVAQYGLFTYKSVPVIFEPPCTILLYMFRASSAHLQEDTVVLMQHMVLCSCSDILVLLVLHRFT